MAKRPVLGQENSAGLDGCRPTINSIMFGEATALAHIAVALGNRSRARHFEREAAPQPALSSRPGDRHLFVTAFGADAKGNIAALTQRIVAARANISASKVRARARRNRPTRAALATPPTLPHSR